MVAHQGLQDHPVRWGHQDRPDHLVFLEVVSLLRAARQDRLARWDRLAHRVYPEVE